MSSPSLRVEEEDDGNVADVLVGVANQVAVPHLPSQETQVAVAQNDVGVHPKSISQRESEGFIAFNKRFEDW